MMAPDYAHWHGMYEVAERFYMELIPQAREIAEHAAAEGKTKAAEAVNAVIEELLARPEHEWFQQTKTAATVTPQAPADDTNDPPQNDPATAADAPAADAPATDADSPSAAGNSPDADDPADADNSRNADDSSGDAGTDADQ